MCVLYIVVYIDAISVNSPFMYMICQALHQPSYKFVHSLYVFCHYHYYKPTFLYISELINVFIYFVTYRPIGPGAFCVFVYVTVYNYVNVCTSHNNKPFTYLNKKNTSLYIKNLISPYAILSLHWIADVQNGYSFCSRHLVKLQH